MNFNLEWLSSVFIKSMIDGIWFLINWNPSTIKKDLWPQEFPNFWVHHVYISVNPGDRGTIQETEGNRGEEGRNRARVSFSLSLALSLSPSLSLSLYLSINLKLSLSHKHTHIKICTISYTFPLTHSLIHTRRLWEQHTHSYTNTHACTQRQRQRDSLTHPCLESLKMHDEGPGDFHQILGQVVRIYFELCIGLIPSAILAPLIQRDQVDE